MSSGSAAAAAAGPSNNQTAGPRRSFITIAQPIRHNQTLKSHMLRHLEEMRSGE